MKNSSHSPTLKRIVMPKNCEDSCLICESTESLRSLYLDYVNENNGCVENYSEMIISCYNLEFIDDEQQCAEICERCIDNLKNAFAFRKKIEGVQMCFGQETCNKSRLIINKSNRNHSRNDVKSKPPKLFPPAKKNKPDKLAENATECPICKATAINFFRLRRHYFSHFHKHVCETCGKGFLDKIKLKNHMKKHEDKIFECEECKKTYTSKSTLMQHVKLVHKKVMSYPCRHCAERFPSYTPRLKHMVEKHGMEYDKNKCDLCDKSFYTLQTLRRHKLTVHEKIKPYACRKCSYKSMDKHAFKKHLLTHQESTANIPCTVCERNFETNENLKEHMEESHSDSLYVCLYCGDVFVREFELSAHITDIHSYMEGDEKQEGSIMIMMNND